MEMGIGGIKGDEGDAITCRIIEAIIKVHATLGPGFLEVVYRRALLIELTKAGMLAETEVEVYIRYDGQIVGRHRLDLLVDRRIIVEVKTVEELVKAHYSQVRSYLKATGLLTALLVNFSKEKADYRRIERA